MEAADAGRLKFGFCLGGNLVWLESRRHVCRRGAQQARQLVYLNTTLNTGHAHGLAKETIILPVLARDEEPQPTTQESMFNYVRLSDGGPRRHEGPRERSRNHRHDRASQTLGNGGPIDWQSMQNTGKIREAIAKVVPGFEQLADDRQNRSKNFTLPAGRFISRSFPTPDGRAKIHIHELPELPRRTAISCG